jgi:ABC-type branched-subunit amino acid transport system ATPase component
MKLRAPGTRVANVRPAGEAVALIGRNGAGKAMCHGVILASEVHRRL